jgi:hypothetical protein
MTTKELVDFIREANGREVWVNNNMNASPPKWVRLEDLGLGSLCYDFYSRDNLKYGAKIEESPATPTSKVVPAMPDVPFVFRTKGTDGYYIPSIVCAEGQGLWCDRTCYYIELLHDQYEWSPITDGKNFYPFTKLEA